MSAFHPELRARAQWLPNIPATSTTVRALQWLSSLPTPARKTPGVTLEVRTIAGPPGAGPVSVRVFRPEGLRSPAPALLWMHGGGFVLGNPAQDDGDNARLAKELGIVVVAPRYRLAPQNPFPAPLEDCYAALTWIDREGVSLGVDRARVAIGGASAGGGLTAGLALMARDREGPKPVFQLLRYPMLDDRTTLRDDIDERNFRLWNQRNNRFGWSSYLGARPGVDGISVYAAPARCESLAGVAPAWLGIGTLDLFHDEDLAYARALRAAGVPCALDVVDGGYHAFDVVSPDAKVVRRFRASQTEALRAALFA
jgi:acetyl esterase/lipase